MKDRGIVHMGVGHGKGENRLEEAVTSAVDSPLLETKISGARAVLVNITGGRDLTMLDVDKVATRISDEADSNAIIILGASVKEDLTDEIAVTVIAAGFEKSPAAGLIDPVLPKKSTEAAGFEEKPAEPKVESPFGGGISGIDVPSFLK